MRGNKKDLTGKRFGKIVALYKTDLQSKSGYPLWRCRCDCGVEKNINSYNLLYNPPISCGCHTEEINKRHDWVGKKSGKLTIIGRDTVNRHKIIVQCDCGNIKTITKVNFGKSTKSCGCWKKETSRWLVPGNKKAPGEAARNGILSGYKRGAKDRGLVWELTIRQFEEITKSDCYYCGIPPYRKGRTETNNGHYIYNGIDRVDNDRGYEINNVVPCCKTCNRAKDTMPHQEFINWVKRVCDNFNLKNKSTIYIYENNHKAQIKESEAN